MKPKAEIAAITMTSLFIGFPFPVHFWNFVPPTGLPRFIIIDEFRKKRIREVGVNFDLFTRWRPAWHGWAAKGGHRRAFFMWAGRPSSLTQNHLRPILTLKKNESDPIHCYENETGLNSF
jgi:hypothetical protein